MAWCWLIAGLILLGIAGFRRKSPGKTAHRALASVVTQQHLHLFQGGRLSATAVAAARAQLGHWLAGGELAPVEAALSPGLNYAVNVQALTEIGGGRAADVMHRQLIRAVSADPIEQGWYWIDLAHGLRRVNRAESVPHLLRCPAVNRDGPLTQFFAAETACCAGFVDTLSEPQSPLGRSAARVLHATLRGLRHGLSLCVIADARLGDAVTAAWRGRPDHADARLVRVFVEALRLVQRIDHVRMATQRDARVAENVEPQLAALADMRAALSDYLSDAPEQLLAAVPSVRRTERGTLFGALDDLRVDAAEVVIRQLRDWSDAEREAAIRLLRWSPSLEVGRWLCDWAHGSVMPKQRAARAPRAAPPARSSLTEPFPYVALLTALRGQPAEENEAYLLLAARDWDPTYRAAAFSSLGWNDPIQRLAVHAALQTARQDASTAVATAAESALARLGERRALHSIRAALAGESDDAVTSVLRRVADERIFWLWPDLNVLAESSEGEIAWSASEALELMREDAVGGVLTV